jgi:hypothetical protein
MTTNPQRSAKDDLERQHLSAYEPACLPRGQDLRQMARRQPLPSMPFPSLCRPRLSFAAIPPLSGLTLPVIDLVLIRAHIRGLRNEGKVAFHLNDRLGEIGRFR